MEAFGSDPILLAIGASSVALLLGLALFVAVRLRRRAEERVRARSGPRWPDPLAESMRLVLEEDDDGAMRVLKGALAEGEDAPVLYLALGALLRRGGDAQRAAALHRGLTVRRGLDAYLRAEAYRQVALDLMVLGRHDEAAKAAQEASARRPMDPVLLTLDRDSAYEAGDVDRALASHYRAVKVSGRPDPRVEASIFAARADRSYREGDRSGARRDVRRALKAHPACARAQFLRARLDSDDGKPEQAAEALQSLHQAEPGLSALILPHLATALQAQITTRLLVRRVCSRCRGGLARAPPRSDRCPESGRSCQR